MTCSPAGPPERRSLQISPGRPGEKACGTGHELFAILADLDGLRPVIDQEGPPQGVRLPCAVLDALSCEPRRCAVLGRSGGDEFGRAGSGGRDAGTRLPQRAAPEVRWGAGLAFGDVIAARPSVGEGRDDVLPQADRALPGVLSAAGSPEHGR